MLLGALVDLGLPLDGAARGAARSCRSTATGWRRARCSARGCRPPRSTWSCEREHGHAQTHGTARTARSRPRPRPRPRARHAHGLRTSIASRARDPAHDRAALDAGGEGARRPRSSGAWREAEAAVHGTTPEEVHFHEVGAVDSIVDVVGGVIGLGWLGVERFVASPLNVGTGTVTMSHGTFPVPPPATAPPGAGRARLRRGRRRAAHADRRAARHRATPPSYGPLPRAAPRRRGLRRGHARHPGPAQRAAADRGRARMPAPARDERVLVLEAEIDDMSPQLCGPLLDRLLAAGALDAYYTPVQMKKGRPGVLVTRHRASRTGARRSRRCCSRRRRPSACAGRSGSAPCSSARWCAVETPYGAIGVKVGRRGGPRLQRAAGVRRLPARGRGAAACRSRRSGRRRSPAYRAPAQRATMKRHRTLFQTTPIYYVNDVPHVGPRLHTIAADALARARRLQGHDVFFLTGTDEHGQNIERIAREKGMPPQEYCDTIAARFQELWERARHHATTASSAPPTSSTSAACSSCGRGCARRTTPDGRPAVYRGKYAGWYCPRCEAFKDEDELKQPGNLCPDHERPCEWTEEENFFFRLSAYRRVAAARRSRAGALAHRARGPPQRGAGRDPAGAAGLQRQPRPREVGHPRARGAGPRLLRLDGRARELHHRARLRGRRADEYRKFWERRRRADALRRQGDHPLPLPVLAGHAARPPACPCPRACSPTAGSPRTARSSARPPATSSTPTRSIDAATAPTPFRYFFLREGSFGQDWDFTDEAFVRPLQQPTSPTTSATWSRAR